MKASTSTSKEFNNFVELSDKLLSVPHAEIKAKLEAEKNVKAQKKKAKKSKE